MKKKLFLKKPYTQSKPCLACTTCGATKMLSMLGLMHDE